MWNIEDSKYKNQMQGGDTPGLGKFPDKPLENVICPLDISAFHAYSARAVVGSL